LRVKRGERDVKVEVTADGEGLVSHAGAALIVETADRLGLTSALELSSWAVAGSPFPEWL
jgi:hypothetical protein